MPSLTRSVRSTFHRTAADDRMARDWGNRLLKRWPEVRMHRGNKDATSKIRLPKAWSQSVRTAVLAAIALARFGIAHTRGWAADSANAHMRLTADKDRLTAEIGMLREELRIRRRADGADRPAAAAELPARGTHGRPGTPRGARLDAGRDGAEVSRYRGHDCLLGRARSRNRAATRWSNSASRSISSRISSAKNGSAAEGGFSRHG